MTSETPRTDAFAASCMTNSVLIAKKSDGRNEKANLQELEWLLAVEHARQLERELSARAGGGDADTIISAIIEDICKRRGLEDAWEEIDVDISVASLLNPARFMRLANTALQPTGSAAKPRRVPSARKKRSPRRG